MNQIEKIHIPFDKKYLLAVSGGIDSMVMATFFLNKKIHFEIAHCNFKLRGKDSDDDQSFIENWCHNNQVKLHTTHFETEKYSSNKGISIQMAARELRYNWFFEIKNNLDYIVTAHHLDDQVETFFLNLARGTGISGLTGIKNHHNLLFRPFTNVPKSEIAEYARIHKITYREDSSNLSTKYKRNKVRHQIIPLMETLNPSFIDTMRDNLLRLNEIESIYFDKIDDLKKEICIEKDYMQIDIKKLTQLPYKKSFLYEVLKDKNFNESMVSDMIDSMNQVGLIFESSTNLCTIDRDFILVKKKDKLLSANFLIKKADKIVTNPIHLTLEELAIDSVELKNEKNVALFDYDKIDNELTINNWKHGDYFYPFGMKGRKKISDYLTDIKLNRFEKEQTYVLRSNGDIVWVINHRIDNRYKIDENTRKVLKITYKI